ncbi:MAG: AAA family ATPase [Syntrophaceae bacterium]|nr:AAA family ATPase [Syntrophaceae bacterium]
MDYVQFYGFSRMPFGEDKDREAFFPSETHREALASILYGIRERKGYIVVFGGRGMGKTELVRQAMERLDEGTRAVLIAETHERYYQLLKELTVRLGLRTAESSKGPLLHELYEFLIRCLEKGENVVLFLDDAHRMKDEIVEELRLMSNLETSRTKLIQIVILGEPELDQRLSAKHLRQIRQRIQILHRLAPFGPDESRRYIEHQLAWAGGSAGVFTPEAIEALCKASGGIPGNLDALCGGALALGAERSENPVSARAVRDAQRAAASLIRPDSSISTAAASGRPALRSPWLYGALAAAAAFVMLGGWYYYGKHTAGVAKKEAAVTAQTAAKAPTPAAKTRAREEAPAPAPPAPVRGTVAREPADRGEPMKTVVVPEGATLSSIATRQYGMADATILDHILESNPEINDVDLILTGSQVLLPQSAGKARIMKGSDGSFSVHAATFMTQREARGYVGKIGSDLGRVELVKRRVAPQKEWYRVVAGPFASREEAVKALEALGRRAVP